MNENTRQKYRSWRRLQARTSPRVLDALVKRNLWNLATGPDEALQPLIDQLSPYFGFYPDSETLRAEFKSEFRELDQGEQDGLFRLVKSLALGRDLLDSGPTPG